MQIKGVHTVSVEKPEWIKQFGRPRLTLENNNQTDFHEIIFGNGLNPAGS
jgi:hypothetical protein